MPPRRPNLVLILTDTQAKCMIGAYGEPAFRTPCLDDLAASGLRFERAYTACPLCTPARGALFTGQYPANHGAWANEMSPMRHVPLAGSVFRALGYRAGYTGKWHLDGSGYHGGGIADGGFEPQWWYDGTRYLRDVGKDRHKAIVEARLDGAKLHDMGVSVSEIWGHRVAERALEFLRTVGDDPFLLVVSFDEPHGPFAVPPEFSAAVDPATLPRRPNFNAPLDDKPRLQQLQREQYPCDDWPVYARERAPHWNCNAYIDQEIGRVVDAVRSLHGDDTFVVYTSDHGDMLGSHGLRSKGAMMYEETVNVPLIISGPGIEPGGVTHALASHLDLLPTFLTWVGAELPPYLAGRALQPILADAAARVRDDVLVQFNRFGMYHDGSGGLCPIRCLLDERYKLVINLHDTDEFYDLSDDPYECRNRIGDPELADARDHLHERLLAEMARVADPFRDDRWRNRPWRAGRVESPYFFQPLHAAPEGLRHGGLP